MTLACPHSIPEFNLIESLVWSIGLLLPVATFLALPKLLPLGRELRWTRVRALWPLAWLSSRLSGDRAEAGSWRARLHEAWTRDLHAAHAEGTRVGEAARDPRLAARARWIGWGVAAFVLALFAWSIAALMIEREPENGWLALAIAFSAPVTCWVARVGASGAALWTQALVRGRGPLTRIAIGLALGGGYGAVGGFTAGFFGLWVLVPVLSLETRNPPASYDMMIGLTLAGVASALVGSLIGAATCAPLALAVREPRHKS
jgi:hypothetical protein